MGAEPSLVNDRGFIAAIFNCAINDCSVLIKKGCRLSAAYAAGRKSRSVERQAEKFVNAHNELSDFSRGDFGGELLDFMGIDRRKYFSYIQHELDRMARFRAVADSILATSSIQKPKVKITYAH